MLGRARPVGNRLGFSSGSAHLPGSNAPSIDRVNRARYTSGTLFKNLIDVFPRGEGHECRHVGNAYYAGGSIPHARSWDWVLLWRSIALSGTCMGGTMLGEYAHGNISNVVRL